MRQLKISRQHADPAREADRAQALPLLRSLDATQPLPLNDDAREQLFRFIVAVATQYRGQGSSWEELLKAGYSAAAECLAQGGKATEYLGWRVRQGILRALPEKKDDTDEL